MEEIKIEQFILSYNGGIYSIEFNLEGENFMINVDILPENLNELWKKEGFNSEQESDPFILYKQTFKESILKISVFRDDDNKIDGFLTTEYADNLQDRGICLIYCEVEKAN
ncbi:MAG: hypothetical protein KKC03_03300 [Bacteroidetes bacterium]|nr:hypothetical protein [Bacteroidota bacterium]